MTPQTLPRHAIVLSAASAEQLVDYAARIRDRLVELTGTPDADDNARHRPPSGADVLAAVAYTLQVGRVSMAHRLAVVVADLSAAVDALEAYLAGRVHPALALGTVTEPASGPTPVPATEAEAAAAWVAGYEIDWRRYWPEPPRRVSLPARPWRSTPATAAPREDEVSAAAQQYLISRYAEISGIPASRVDPHLPLDQLGLSSFLVTRLVAQLHADLGETDRTLFYSHPTLASVASELARRHPERWRAAAGTPSAEPAERARDADVPPAEVKAPALVASVPARAGDDLDELPQNAVAIIGIAGRYPKSPNLDAFWDNLSNGRDCVTPFPADRARPGWPTHLMFGGFLDDVDRFDPLLFQITPRDADLMDPQERIFLEAVWEALEDAGYPRDRLRHRHSSRVAVFAGAMHNEYPYFGVEQSMSGRWQDSGATLGGIANRVSYFLDLHGPSLTVDTMCSSSMVAIHLAVRALRSGEAEVAIAGAVNLSLHPNKFVQLHRMKLTASDHRCRSFGAGGDGFVPAEGVGVVVLKLLRRAVADGDRIHAVIRGTAVVHAGRTNGYLVPNPNAQTEMVRQALADAGVDAATIGYLEAHGAGTALGDPVEIKGLLGAFGGLPVGSIPIGSVKSTIGHVEPAAGIAGLTKVVLQLKHGMLAPSLHAERLNPNVEWDAVPFRVQRELAPWPAGDTPRRAGISSFGAGGTITHVVVEEYVPRAARPAYEPRPQLVVLSAYDADRLRALVRRMLDHLDRRLERGDIADLDDLAYTLQVGREPLRERLAVVVQSTWQLREELRAYLDGRPSTVVTGRAPRSAPPGDPAVPGTDLAAVARRWVSGEPVDWERLYQGRRRPQIASLPHYPFARMRCWLPEAQTGAAAPDTTAGDPALPPHAGPALGPTAGASVPVADGAAETPLYERVWVPAGPIPPAAAPDGPVVCVFSEHSERAARAIAATGGRFILVREGADLRDGVPSFLTEADAEHLAERILAEHPDLAGWVDLADLYRPNRERGLWQARLAALRRVVAARAPRGLRVLQVTSGLQPDTEPPGLSPSLAGARTAAFVRVIGAEHRRLVASVLDTDVPADRSAELAAHVLGEWGATDPYGEICHRAGVRLRPALRPIEAPWRPWRADPGGAYVVTGGTRGLGALVARFLADCGARHLAVLGRRPVSDSAVDDLRARGVTVLVHSGPLTDQMALGGFLDQVRERLGPIRGIVHCAGTGSRGAVPFAAKDPADISAVLEPKVDGLDTLAELTAGDPLEFVVAFSSVCAAVPTVAVGVSEYAAANGYLDYAVAHRIRAGQTCYRSVNWPQWTQTGGGVGQPNPCASVGIAGLDDAAGLRVLERVLSLPTGCRVLPVPPLGAPVDPDTLVSLDRPATAPQPAKVSSADAVSAVDVSPPAKPPAASRPARWLVDIFAQTLRIPAADLDPTASFSDLGVESIMLGELLRAIERHLGRPLEPATLLDYPTLEQLSAHLGVDEPAEPSLEDAPAAASAPVPPAADQTTVAGAPTAVQTGVVGAPTGGRMTVPATPAADRIAVIGVACRFPGAPDVETFWQNLVGGVCSVGEVPRSRWDHRIHYDPQPRIGASISKWGGFVDGIEDFDPGYFNLSDEEGTALDPAIRMFLEAAVTCLRDAGYADGDLAGQPVGVFVGARMSDYGRRVALAPSVLRSDQNFIAAHVAHFLDLRGPNLVVDSACSSSLVSVQLAVRSLLDGESTMALAGGVEVLLDEQPYLDLSAARALSPSGLCRTFDERADGFVPGEGCGVVLLKPLRAALADGDRIYAVIESVAVNNDGRTMGITTPNPAAQAAVVRRALNLAGRRPEEIGMVEAHGTGTLIGDPIELRALTDVFGDAAGRTGWCAIGSVKSNLGHLLSAAGIAGLIKVVLSLDRGVIPPTLHCDRPNPRFDFDRSPFYPNTVARPWDRPPGERVAGVSSFGLGGTNAHLIASGFDPALREEHPPPRPKLPAPVFRRRRLWLERPDAAVPHAPALAETAPVSPAPAGPPPVSPAPAQPVPASTVASILDLELITPVR